MTRFHRHPLSGPVSCAIAILLSLLAAACGRTPSFRLEGEVKGADGSSMYVQRAGYDGRWLTIDSAAVLKDGHFAVEVPAAGVPDIYRLCLGDRYIYFPVDSTETITVRTTAPLFGSSFTVDGSPQARSMANFDREASRLDMTDKKAVENFKRRVFGKFIRDGRGSLLSYYVLTKTIGGKPLFDVRDISDVKYISAVATSFKAFRPDDPRTKVLEEMALEGQRLRNKAQGKKVVLKAGELKVIDISLPGVDGKETSLAGTMRSGIPTVVVFSSVAAPGNAELMLRLKELHASKAGRVDFFNVNVDGDSFEWRNSARNLPWTSVYASTASDGKVFTDYNVSTLPAFFLYSPQGELIDRAEDFQGLSALISAY